MYISVQLKYILVYPILIKFEFSRQVFKKSLNNKFYKNPPPGSRVTAWGRTDGQT